MVKPLELEIPAPDFVALAVQKIDDQLLAFLEPDLTSFNKQEICFIRACCCAKRHQNIHVLQMPGSNASLFAFPCNSKKWEKRSNVVVVNEIEIALHGDSCT